jgi:small subunit ribosomal protein S6
MAFYECVFIIRPDVPTPQVTQVAEKMVAVVEKQNGKVIKNEDWGLRTLAYRVKKYKKGYYILLGLDMPGDAVAELERQLKLSEDIIRFQTVRVDHMDETPSVMMKYKAKFESDEAAPPAAS